MPESTNTPFPPVFATNRHDRAETVAGEINRLLSGMREHLASAPAVDIATAYINPGGFALIADELEQAPQVRLLLGAEPDPRTGWALEASSSTRDDDLDSALSEHVAWLAHERNLLGFTRENLRSTDRLIAWLRSQDADGQARVSVRRYTQGFLHGKAYVCRHPALPAVLAGSSNFTRAGLSLNAELNLGYPAGNGQHVALVQDWFEGLWQASEPYDLAGVYESVWEPHEPWLVFLRMLSELYGGYVDDDSAERAELQLTGFQRDGVARMVRLLDSLGGVLVADEVGLGKTFLAGEVIARAANRDRQRVLIICPAALKASMWEPFLEQHDFSRRVKVYSYDELRLKSDPDDPDHAQFLTELDDYAVVVVDEAHNLRNATAQRAQALFRLVAGVNPKKTVLLTATPVNNSLMDLHTLLTYFIRNDAAFVGIGINSIRDYIKKAQARDPESLSPEHLFDLMDQVAVRRTRRFVKEFYPNDEIVLPDGSRATIQFPTPRTYRIDYTLDAAGQALLEAVLRALYVDGNHDLVTLLGGAPPLEERLALARYTPSAYLRREGGVEAFQVANAGLLRSALLKRLESSPAALQRTLETLITSHEAFLTGLEAGHVLTGEALREWTGSESEDFDEWVLTLDEDAAENVGDVAAYDVERLRADVEADLALLRHLQALAQACCDGVDPKAEVLIGELRRIATEARTPDRSGLPASTRRKALVFSTYADTIDDLHRRVLQAITTAAPEDPLSDYAGRVPDVIKGQKVGIDQGHRARVLAGFAPETAGPRDAQGNPTAQDQYDLLLTTDVLSEGVNLQQAGRIVNYDLPWNPMRLVQRHGRIDRIGSSHAAVALGCFFPSQHLEVMLKLEVTLQRKLAYADAAVGAGEVLPGFQSQFEVNLQDTLEQIEQLRAENPELFENRGSSAALSGEEYRRRLEQALTDPFLAQQVEDLPWKSGSGFINPRAARSGYVFCMRMGAHAKPWFRFVPVKPGTWEPATETAPTSEGHLAELPIVDADTLTSLITADPVDGETPRVLTDEAFEGAFAAWEVASHAALDDWLHLTDPNSLMPEVPKALRDASQLVADSGGAVLSHAEQRELLDRLNCAPPNRVQREFRALLKESISSEEKVQAVKQLAEDAGLQPVKVADPLDYLEPPDVHLIAWMAVQGRDWAGEQAASA